MLASNSWVQVILLSQTPQQLLYVQLLVYIFGVSEQTYSEVKYTSEKM